MKPIEPGCLALWRRFEFAETCQVRLDNCPSFKGRCDICSGDVFWFHSGAPGGVVASCTCRLTRIDGDPDEAQEQEGITDDLTC